MDLDGYGSPRRLADRIHARLPDLKPNFNVIELAKALDIVSVEEAPVKGFTAMLLTDELKRDGHIVLAAGQAYKRRRFSICHELGHFLIDSHKPGPNGHCQCTDRDLNIGRRRGLSKDEKMEVEANAFAARLLMPLHKLKADLRAAPSLETVVTLAEKFKVSKDAMARTYAEHHDEPVAILVTHEGKYKRAYYDKDRFPWLSLRKGDRLPASAEYFSAAASSGSTSDINEVDPEDWLLDPHRDEVLALREQVLWQREGFALVLLEAKLDEAD